MKHLFVPYETALELKEKGFDESCLGYYNWKKVFAFMTMGVSNSDAEQALPDGTVTAPIYQQVIDWFREKHNIDIFCQRDWVGGNCLGYCANIENDDGIIETETYDNYYKALDKAIEEALKLI